MDLVPICVDVVQSCGSKADLKSIARGTKIEAKTRTTYG
jgi:hypothetical protein